MELNINGKTHRFDGDPDTPLLWVIRDGAQLTGTKFGCGIGMCGACTVHVDGQAVRSCAYTAYQAKGKKVTTIEGLTKPAHKAVQSAWVAEDVPQCGYCQSGMIMHTCAMLDETPQPTDAQIDEKLTNLCRCATYHRIRIAVHRVAGIAAQAGKEGSK